MANIIIFFIISLSSFDNLCFVGSFDNILVFFPLIIINLWFVCFFDDSIRVRLVPLIILVLVCLLSFYVYIGIVYCIVIYLVFILIFFIFFIICFYILCFYGSFVSLMIV